MGLLTNLLLLPVTGPYRGLRFLLEQIQEEAYAELYDERGIQAALMALGLSLDQGEIAEDEYLAAEAALLERLSQARAARAERSGEPDTVEADGNAAVTRTSRAAELDVLAGDEAWTE